jgi:dipeptidase E
MKLLLASWGPWINQVLETTFLDLLPKPTQESNVFILSVDTTSETHITHLKIAKEWYQKIGFKEENITILNLYTDTIPSFSNLDVLHIWGGNNYEYLKVIREKRLESRIREFIDHDGVYVGSSAGSNIMCPDVDVNLFNDPNDVGLDDVTGFGYIDFYLIVHWGTSNGEKRTSQINYGWKMGKRFIPLTDHQAILVRNKGFKIISP